MHKPLSSRELKRQWKHVWTVTGKKSQFRVENWYQVPGSLVSTDLMS